MRGVLPPGVTEILDAFAAATRGGRQVTEGTLKNTADRMSVALKDFTEALAACDEDYRVDWEPGAVVTVHLIDDEGRKPVAQFATRIAERAADQGVLLEDRERKVLEDELLAALAQQIHGRVIAARDLTRDMNSDTRSKPMSSGIAVGIRWAQSDKVTELQRATSRLLERDSPGPERLAELRGLLREMIREYRASHPRATYREALANVLDYRSWHAFELLLIQPGEPEARLTRAKHSVMSGGEKSAAIHLPLFAAANALYSSAKDHCPRMIALDEAFVGIDERYKPDLFGLAVKFDLDLFMTGHDLWVTTATVPMIAHYDMLHDKTTRTVSSLLMLWDGEQVVDASAGYARQRRPGGTVARLPADPARAARHRLHVVRGAGGSRGSAGRSRRRIRRCRLSMTDPYDEPEFRRLLKQARRSLERTGGDLSGSVSLSHPDDAERKAIIGITGQYRDMRANRIAVRLADLDHAVRETTGRGLAELLAELGGPLHDRPAERNALARAQAAALSAAQASSLHLLLRLVSGLAGRAHAGRQPDQADQRRRAGAARAGGPRA